MTKVELRAYFIDRLIRIKKRKANRVGGSWSSEYADSLDSGRQMCIREMARDFDIKLPLVSISAKK